MHEQVHGNNAAPAVNTNPLADLLAQLDPAEVLAAAKGLMTVLAAFQTLADPESPASTILMRLGLLANAKWLPDTGTGDVDAIRFLMGGCSDDHARKAAKMSGARRIEPTGRGSSMWRPGEIAQRAAPHGESSEDDSAAGGGHPSST